MPTRTAAYDIRELEVTEEFDVTSVSSDEAVSFTQSQLYGYWKQSQGHSVQRYVVTNGNGTAVAYFLFIVYPLIRDKSYFYLPYGPVVADQSQELLSYIREQLKQLAAAADACFVRLDFAPPLAAATLSQVFRPAPEYTYHAAHFLPRLEWVLPLDRPQEEIFMQTVHKKTRYSIRQAEKKDVTVEIVTERFLDYFETFYNIMNTTAERNDFGLHTKDYYHTVFESLNESNGYLSVARYNDKVLVIDLMVIYNGTAHYVFGCSSNEERERMPAYLALWKSIGYAQEKGCSYFNFGGISSGTLYKGWDGLTAFKKRFGGRELEHSPLVDIVLQPFWYRLYCVRRWIKFKLK